MKLMDYIDQKISPVPQELLMPIHDIIELEESRLRRGTTNYRPKLLNPELEEWLHQQFDPGFILRARYFVAPGPIGKHRDTNGRLFALNYILDPGGPDVVTSIYDDDRNTVLASLRIEPCRWHYITTGMIHDVTNVTHSRVGISVTPNHALQRSWFDQARESLVAVAGIEPATNGL